MLNTGSEAAIRYRKEHSIVIDGGAQDRLQSEADRIAEIKSAATPPAECGWLIPSAPGRGGFVMFMPTSMQENEKGEMVKKPAGHAGRSAIRSADVFDRMIAAAEKGKRQWPLTPGQIAAGRRYRDLVEWRASGAIKCSSIDGHVAGSGECDFMDAYLAAGRELDGIRRRIGSGMAMELRRVRPSRRGDDKAVPIFDRVMVDMICLKENSLKEVLIAHKWQANGRNLKSIREALSAALDRMIGYRREKSS